MKALNLYGIDQSGASFLPVKVGVKQYLSNHFFVEGQVGAAILLSGGNIYNRYRSAYIYTAGFGYTLRTDWNSASDTRTGKKILISQAALRVSYRFK